MTQQIRESGIERVRLNTDSFLFACHEAQEARTRKNGTFNSHLRFEPFLMGSFVAPEKPDVKKLKSQIQEIATHHYAISPQFRRNEDIDIETISYFSHAIATLFADFDHLIKIYAGVGLPKIPSENAEYSDSYPLLTASIKKYSAYQSALEAETAATPFELFPLGTAVEDSDENAQDNQSAVFASEVWDMISGAIAHSFPNHAQAILSYAFWKYRTQETREPSDWRVRPPVGEEFNKQFKLPGGGRPDRGGKGGGRFGDKKPFGDRKGGGDKRHGGHDRPGRGGHGGGDKRHQAASGRPNSDRGDRSDRSERADTRPERTESRERSHPQDARPNRGGDRGPRSHDRQHPRGDGGGRGQADGGQTSPETLERAMDEVQDAVAYLKANPKVPEVVLSPGNSFVRREQHSIANDAGFETESRGEGKERCVCVKRRSVH